MSNTELELGGSILGFDEEKREIEVLLIPWDKEASQSDGVHRFKRGAFAGVEPGRLKLRQRHNDPPTGVALSLSEEEDGQHARFRISRTPAGDEQLTLIKDGVENGISVGFSSSKYDKDVLSDGRTRYTHLNLAGSRELEASTTWRPAFAESQVLSVFEENSPMTEATEPEVIPSAPVAPPVSEEVFKAMQADMAARFEALQDRVAAQQLILPDDIKRQHESAQKIAFSQQLIAAEVPRAFEIDDVTSTDHEGVLPPAYLNRMIGIIDSSRPFMESTTRLPTPPAGEKLILPKIEQRPTVAKQSVEKTELSSQATKITTVDFDMATYGGVGDLSIQLIKRSSPSFLEMWSSLLGEAYAITTDDAAVDALLADGDINSATNPFDPAAPSFGEAFANAATAAGSRPSLLPNRMWLSTAALVAFIDAKSPTGGGGTPLYPGLAGIAGITGGGGDGPAGFSMRPVWVPALDDESVDMIIGPAAGFCWVEDGTYTLSTDVPEKAGRDVGLVGLVWFAPLYGGAFTTYTLSS